jgi:hypothetical protein
LPGTKFLFQIAIQILQYNQTALLEVHDDGEAMQLLTEFTESICNKDSPLQIQVVLIFSTRKCGLLSDHRICFGMCTFKCGLLSDHRICFGVCTFEK